MRVIFRSDASLEIGTGHVMRCLTLATSLKQVGAEVAFICRELPGNLIGRIRSKKIDVTVLPASGETAPEAPPDHAAWAQVRWERDAQETKSILRALNPDWLVVDHYAFDARWEKAVRQGEMHLMVIDDLADRPHDCDLLLDQNLGREKEDYEELVPTQCRLLIGPRFALLRPEFAARRAESLRRRQNSRLEHVLVSMGGIDRENTTGRVLMALEESELPASTGVSVVLGANAPWFTKVVARSTMSARPIQVLRDVADMASLMHEADLAIGAAGATSWERCCLGLPTVLITLADNQHGISQALVQTGAAISAGASNSPKLEESVVASVDSWQGLTARKHQSERAAQICDGDGAARVCNQILSPDVKFRNVALGDARRIWEWRQFADHERFSKDRATPSFAEHCEWLEGALSNPNRIIRILQNGPLPCGYVRLDFEKAERATISICLAQDAQGQGLASVLLREAEDLVLMRSAHSIDAEIHAENVASIKTFSSAGYRRIGSIAGFSRYEKRIGNSG